MTLVKQPEQKKTQLLSELTTSVTCTAACQITAVASAKVGKQKLGSKPVTLVLDPGVPAPLTFRFPIDAPPADCGHLAWCLPPLL